MKLLRLQFKNINSLKGEHQINFAEAPLSETGIFAIVGPTGSGKSTLLDAITLALYGRVPRINRPLSKAELTNTGSILTESTYETYSEVEYETNGKQYRSKWSVHRAKKSGLLQDYHMELSEVLTDTIFDLKKGEVPNKNRDIIGLDYEQFIKSILLSQGEFAKFLHASSDERGALLEKITGTDIYRRIGVAAFERTREAKQALELLEAKASETNLLSADELAELLSVKKTNEEKRQAFSKELVKIRETLSVKKNLATEQAEASKLQRQIDALELEKLKLKATKSAVEKHKLLQPLLPQMQELKLVTGQKNSLQTQQNKLNEQIEANKIAGSNLLQQNVQATGIFEVTLAKQNKIEPVVLAVRELDAQVRVKKQVWEQFVASQKQLKAKYVAAERSIKKLNQSNGLLLHDFELINIQISENKVFQNGGELAIKAKQLHDEGKNQAKAYADELANINGINNTDFKALKDKNLRDTHYKKLLDSALKRIDYLSARLPENASIADFRAKLDKNASEIGRVNELTRLFADKEKASTKLQQNSELSAQTAIKIKQVQLEQTNFLHKKEIADKKSEELQARYERKQLEAKYSDDRQKLKPKSECPLCGSESHPYVNHYVDELLQSKNELNQCKTNIKKLGNELVRVGGVLSAEQTRSSEIERQLHILTQEIAEIEAKIKESAVGFNLNVLSNKGLLQIMQQLNKVSDILKKQIADAEDLEHTNQLTRQLSGLNKYLLRFSELRSELNALVSPFAKLFPNLDTTDFTPAYFSKNQLLYTKLTQKREELERNKVKLQTELQAKELEYQTNKSELQATDAQLSDAAQVLKDIEQKRYTLFQDKDPETEIKQINKQTEAAKDTIVRIEKLLSATKAEQEAFLVQQTHIETSLSQISSQQKALLAKLSGELQSLDYETVEQALTDILTKEQFAKYELKVRTNEDSFVVCKNQLQSTVQKAAQFKIALSGIADLSQIEAKAVQFEASEKELTAENGKIANQLEVNEQNVDKNKVLHNKIEMQRKETHRWQRLSELIGDAQGKNFSKYAQDLTLREMLGLANKHLEKLTERYYIVAPKTIDDKAGSLDIIDSWNGNMRRAAKTLSGGESFLVSLALALGLSDLAGANTKIESLFIDEGFGTLDPDTLDIALTALEKLQMESNRTIGVISHVESLKERITTHIALERSGSGVSELVISG